MKKNFVVSLAIIILFLAHLLLLFFFVFSAPFWAKCLWFSVVLWFAAREMIPEEWKNN